MKATFYKRNTWNFSKQLLLSKYPSSDTCVRPADKILSILFVIFLYSCDRFEYHPYDGRVSGETGLNNKNIARIEAACKEKDTIRFILMSDTQRFYDETEDFVAAVNKRTDVDFVMHGGDISDFGLTKEFMWIRDIMNGLRIPYVTLIGNHDCLANGKDVYRTIFGKENFAFIAGKIKFICLNTNWLEYGNADNVPDFSFIEQQRNGQGELYEKTIFAMHAPPYSEQFNSNVAPLFQKSVTSFSKLLFCLQAHLHNVVAKDLFNDGTMYYGCASIDKRSYLYFTVNPDNTYSYEVVSF